MGEVTFLVSVLLQDLNTSACTSKLNALGPVTGAVGYPVRVQ